MHYRKEIDGLRALAVLPVILFHAGLFGFSGGYIGVDIFFVISGYLITTIILDELDKNTFSIKNFYERRAKRILPALSAVLILTTVLAYIFMPANLLKSYSNSLMSVVTFTSNFHFFTTSGYFSTLSDQKPLLHTWSLAVEEQFYLFFPLLLTYLWAKGKKRITQIVISLSVLSLLLAQYLAINGYADANFYLIFSRAWELFAGSLIALTGLSTIKTKQWQTELLSILGLLLILYSLFFFDKHTLFPSFYALIPVIGTVLIIAFCHEKTILGKVLSLRLLVNIGLISYSLYLWHQPLFAFLRMKSLGEPSENLFIIAILLSFILATLSYHFVEKPFRGKASPNKTPRFSVLQYAAMSIVFFIIIGLIGVKNRGFQARFGESTYLDSVKFSPKRKACHTNGHDYLNPKDGCRYFGKQTTWAVLGDSHTVEPAYALAKALETKDQGILHLSFSGCVPSLMFTVKDPGCSAWFNDSITYLENNPEITNVYLGFYYNGFLYGVLNQHYPDIPDEDPRYKLTAQYQDLSADDIRELYWQGLVQTIERLNKSGKKVYLQYPIPEIPLHINNLLTPFSVFGGELRYDLEKTTPAAYYFERNKFILNKLNTLKYNDKLEAIKPFELLCSNQYCPAVSKGKALYFDATHLSRFGAETLINKSDIVQ